LRTIVSNTRCRSVREPLIAEDLRGGRLPIERLGELAVASLQLFEQVHVLDRDDRLVGERLQQVDLVVRERLDDASRDGDRADGPAVPEHGHGQDGAEHAERVHDVRVGVLIHDLHDRRRQDAAGRRARAAGPLRERPADRLDLLGGPAVLGGEMDQFTVEPVNPREIRPAEQGRRSRDRIEGRLHSGRRARDDAQDLGRRGLPLERLGQRVLQVRIRLPSGAGLVRRRERRATFQTELGVRGIVLVAPSTLHTAASH
jgi:hypothetical protein